MPYAFHTTGRARGARTPSLVTVGEPFMYAAEAGSLRPWAKLRLMEPESPEVTSGV